MEYVRNLFFLNKSLLYDLRSKNTAEQKITCRQSRLIFDTFFYWNAILNFGFLFLFPNSFQKTSQNKSQTNAQKWSLPDAFRPSFPRYPLNEVAFFTFSRFPKSHQKCLDLSLLLAPFLLQKCMQNVIFFSIDLCPKICWSRNIIFLQSIITSR